VAAVEVGVEAEVEEEEEEAVQSRQGVARRQILSATGSQREAKEEGVVLRGEASGAHRRGPCLSRQ